MENARRQWSGVAVAALLALATWGNVHAAQESAKPGAPLSEPVADPGEAALPQSVKAEKALVKEPNDKAAHLQAARAHLAEGAETKSRVEAAEQHALSVLEQYPNDKEALLLAGRASVLKGDPAAATRYYRAATSIDPNNAAAFLALGDALNRLGDEPGAAAAFAKYRELKGMPSLDSQSGKK